MRIKRIHAAALAVVPVALGIATAARADTSAYPPPCPVVPLVQQQGGNTYLFIPDPAKPCSWIVVEIPTGATLPPI